MELWKFGDYKHYTSLKLLTHTLNIPSPKTDLEGSQVAEVYLSGQEFRAHCQLLRARCIGRGASDLAICALPLIDP